MKIVLKYTRFHLTVIVSAHLLVGTRFLKLLPKKWFCFSLNFGILENCLCCWSNQLTVISTKKGRERARDRQTETERDRQTETERQREQNHEPFYMSLDCFLFFYILFSFFFFFAYLLSLLLLLLPFFSVCLFVCFCRQLSTEMFKMQ